MAFPQTNKSTKKITAPGVLIVFSFIDNGSEIQYRKRDVGGDCAMQFQSLWRHKDFGSDELDCGRSANASAFVRLELLNVSRPRLR